MNRFVHRILPSSRSRRSAALTNGVTDLSNEVSGCKLIWFGEFHSEPRIVELQNDLVRQLALRLSSSGSSSNSNNNKNRTARRTRQQLPPPTRRKRLHVIMEHFSVEMQSILRTYQTDDQFQFDDLVSAYKEIGTEGHDLEPYRDLLEFCRGTTLHRGSSSCCSRGAKNDDDDDNGGGAAMPQQQKEEEEAAATIKMGENRLEGCCEVHLHGGFIPRPLASRLNKCQNFDEKKQLFNEVFDRDMLPGPEKCPSMHSAVFADDDPSENLKLNGSKRHSKLIKSMMNGADLYAPIDDGHQAAEGGSTNDGQHEEEEEEVSSPLSKLYQAQLLKDQAMAYFLAKLMLDHHSAAASSSFSDDGIGRATTDDQYLVIAGLGHLKHYLGVPECLNRYLKAESLRATNIHQREVALDLLINLASTPPPASSRAVALKGSTMIGCQMLYETYLEETYAPLRDANELDDEDESDKTKWDVLKDLYLNHRDVLDRLLFESDIVRGPLLEYDRGEGGFDRPCADYLFVYDEDDDRILLENDGNAADGVCPEEAVGDDGAEMKTAAFPPACPAHREKGDGGGPEDEPASASAKAETVDAYNRVGETACRKGNLAKARAIMTQLGYTVEDLHWIGDDDLYNFQGVANPHLVAKIQRGENVLDLGSGLGIDSFLAVRDCGAASSDDDDDGSAGGGDGKGTVVGVDIAGREVRHARDRAAVRGYDDRRVRFLEGDVEKLGVVLDRVGIPPASFNVCISNGAFCLIPNKKRAFQQVFDSLKSGGRMAISTTTIAGKEELDPDFEWPVCMRMFVHLDELKPMCEDVGFVNVEVIDADSPMEMELPVEALEDDATNNSTTGGGRYKIHGKYVDSFKHLQDMNMDDLCRIVTVYGEKR